MLFSTLFKRKTSKEKERSRNLKGRFSKLNSFKYKLYKQRFVNHISKCSCRHCMPHKEVNVRMRVTIVMLILNVFIWLVVIENIKSIISMKNEPIVIENHNSVKSIVPVVSAAETVVEERQEEVINEPINVVNVIKTRFNKAPRTASAVSYAESRHIATKSSDSDKMRDGRPFSVGLFQLNLTWHRIGDLNCPAAFTGKDYFAVVKDESLYDSCVEAAKDPILNIDTAHGIYERSGENFGRWTTAVNGDYKQFLSMF